MGDGVRCREGGGGQGEGEDIVRVLVILCTISGNTKAEKRMASGRRVLYLGGVGGRVKSFK